MASEHSDQSRGHKNTTKMDKANKSSGPGKYDAADPKKGHEVKSKDHK